MPERVWGFGHLEILSIDLAFLSISWQQDSIVVGTRPRSCTSCAVLVDRSPLRQLAGRRAKGQRG